MRVIVCGAGIAGLTAASRLSVAGHEVVLLERAPRPRTQGYMIDFFGSGYDAVEAMGLLPAIERIAYRVEEANLLDEHGHCRGRIRYDQFAKAFGGRLLSITRPDLERVLRDHLPGTVDLRFGVTLTGVEEQPAGVTVTTLDGSTIDADLLIGADGVHSAVREAVFGPESQFLRYLGFHAAAFQFDEPEIYAAAGDRFCLTDTIDRQMAFYALRDGRVATFAVHRTPEPALPHDLQAAVRREYGGLGWLVPSALEHCPPSAEIYYDQVAQVTMPTWHTPRVVLVGDAGYAVSLVAAQGASLGIAGAYLLAHELDRAPSIQQALTGYERRWRPVAEEKQRTGRTAARWFLPESRRQLWIRHVALRVARVPAINRYMAATVAGKSIGLIADLRQFGDARPSTSPSTP